jgi:hypothetical protein
MNILSIFKVLALILEKWSDYVTKKRIEAEIIAESEKHKDEQIVIANSARDDASKLQESADPHNRD